MIRCSTSTAAKCGSPTSHKLFWPELGITKGDLLQYYADVAPVLLPHLRDRAMVMKRYPERRRGRVLLHEARADAAARLDRDLLDRARVGQRHRLPDGAGPRVAAVARQPRLHRPEPVVRALRRRRSARLPALRSRSGARARRSTTVRETALVVRDALEALGMPPLAKTTGSKGIHVYVPIVRGPTQKQVWTFAKQFAHALAERASGADHRRVPRSRSAPQGACSSTTTRTPGAARSRRSIRRGRKPRATVSTPVTWEELEARRRDRGLPHRQHAARASRSSATCGRRCSRSAAASISRSVLLTPMTLPLPRRLSRRWRRSSSTSCPPATSGSTSRSGTASAASRSATATRSTCGRSRASRSTRYFPEVVAALATLPREALRARRRDRRARRRRRCRSTSCCCASIRPQSRVTQARARASRRCSSCSTCSSTSKGKSLVDAAARASGAQRSRRSSTQQFRAAHALRLSPATTTRRDGRRSGSSRSGGGLDGVDRQAARPAVPVRRARPACRRSSACAPPTASSAASATRRRREVVGSLLLGLYDDDGPAAPRRLHARTSRPTEAGAHDEAREARSEPPGFTGSAPGGPSRWSTERSGEWQPLTTELVVEVQYDHFSGGRFRHGTKFLRWRPDKAPRQCTMEQVGAGGVGDAGALRDALVRRRDASALERGQNLRRARADHAGLRHHGEKAEALRDAPFRVVEAERVHAGDLPATCAAARIAPIASSVALSSSG